MLNATHEELLRRAKELDLPTQHHIDGRSEAGDGGSFAVISPRDGQSLVQVADAREAEIDLAASVHSALGTSGRMRSTAETTEPPRTYSQPS